MKSWIILGYFRIHYTYLIFADDVFYITIIYFDLQVLRPACANLFFILLQHNKVIQESRRRLLDFVAGNSVFNLWSSVKFSGCPWESYSSSSESS